MRTIVTFGADHDYIHLDLLGPVPASEGYVVIEAPTYEVAREIAFALFGPRFAFTYAESDWTGSAYYTRGALLEVTVRRPE